MKITELVLRSRLVQKAIKELAETDKAFSISSGSNYPGTPRIKGDLKAASLMNTSYSCMSQRAERVATQENYIIKKNEKIEEHWFYDLIKRPNYHTEQTWIEIKELISYWLDWSGNAFLWMPTYGMKRPIQMWLLPSQNVKILKAEETFVAGYKFTGAGGKVYYLPKEEVVHFRTLMPSTDLVSNFLLGTPKIVQAVQNMILADNEASRYIYEYFNRDGIPPLMMKFDVKLNAPEKAQLKAHWNEVIGDDKILGIIDRGGVLEPLERLTSAGTKNFVESDKVDDKMLLAITKVFKVPQALLLSDSANYATMKEILRDFMMNVIDPIISSIESKLTMHFRQYDAEIEITHNKTEVEDKEYKFKTGNEWRKDNGLEPTNDGDIIFYPKTLSPLIVPEVVEEEPIEPEKMFKSVDEDEKKKVAYWKSFDSISLRGEKNLTKSISKVFKRLQKEITGNLSKQMDWIGNTKGFGGESDLFDIEKWNKILEGDTEPDRSKQAKEALKETLRVIKESMTQTDFEKETAKNTKNSTSKIKDSINVIQDDLKAKIQAIIKNNPLASEAELRRMILDAVDAKFQSNYLNTRASLIAKTTSTFITASTQHGIMTNFKRKFTWLTRRDNKVRSSHAKMDGKKPNRKGFFNVNGDMMQHPTGGEKAKENCQCRCQLHPIGI